MSSNCRAEGVETFDDLPSPLNEPPRSLTTTLAPRDAKKVAYAFPRPPPAPVTTTVWPSKRRVELLIFWMQEMTNEGGEKIEEKKRGKACVLKFGRDLVSRQTARLLASLMPRSIAVGMTVLSHAKHRAPSCWSFLNHVKNRRRQVRALYPLSFRTPWPPAGEIRSGEATAVLPRTQWHPRGWKDHSGMTFSSTRKIFGS